MRAAAIDRYGPAENLTVRSMPDPEFRDHQVRIKVHAAGINPIDWRIRSGQLRFLLPLRMPWIPGFDVSGTVESKGKSVQSVEVGDPVFCYLDSLRAGGYAELAVASAKVVVLKPDNISHQQAAGTPLAALTALQSLRNFGRIKPGHRVLINGASGGVGTFGVQIAKILGGHVTGVCSEQNFKLVKDLGADHLIDYRSEDFTISDQQYDIVFDAVAKSTYLSSRRVLKPQGTYVRTVPHWDSVLYEPIGRLTRRRPSYNMLARSDGGDLRDVAQWITEGKLRVVIDRVLPLDQAAEIHRISEQGHAQGKLVLSIAGD